MARFTFNQPGMRGLANGPEMTRMVLEVAEKGKVYAEAIAPRDTGEYAKSFTVALGSRALGAYSNVRVTAVLENKALYAAAVEFGNVQTRGRAQRVLGKTLAALPGL